MCTPIHKNQKCTLVHKDQLSTLIHRDQKCVPWFIETKSDTTVQSTRRKETLCLKQEVYGNKSVLEKTNSVPSKYVACN